MVPGQQNPPQLSLRSVEPVSSRRQLSQQATQVSQLPKTGDGSSLFLVLLVPCSCLGLSICMTCPLADYKQ